MGSDNPDGADNQQERLIRLGWVVGFVDGEGCFSIGFIRQGGGRGRTGYRTGYQVAHEFAVTQGESSLGALREFNQFFGVGMLVPNRRSDNHREHLYRYVVRRRADLLERIIPFFLEHPLRTAKQENFAKFARCVALIEDGRHRTFDGLIEIAEIAETRRR